MITAQLVVIVDVLMDKRDAMDALRNKRLDFVDDVLAGAAIAKAGGGFGCESERLVGGAQQQQRPAIPSAHRLQKRSQLWASAKPL